MPDNSDYAKIDNLTKPEIREIKELFNIKVWNTTLRNDKFQNQTAKFKRIIMKVMRPLMESSFVVGFAYGKRKYNK